MQGNMELSVCDMESSSVRAASYYSADTWSLSSCGHACLVLLSVSISSRSCRSCALSTISQGDLLRSLELVVQGDARVISDHVPTNSIGGDWAYYIR